MILQLLLPALLNLKRLVLYSGNRLEAAGIIKIARALQKISTLEQLCINYNKIADRASDDIAAICSHNTHLQVFHCNKNSFTFTKASELCQRCKEILNSNIDILV